MKTTTSTASRAPGSSRGPRVVEPSRSDAFDEFAAAWDQMSRVVRRARGRASATPRNGLTVSQFHLLDTLSLEADAALHITEVAEAAGVTCPTATRMLNTLEREGIVRRQRARGDARVVVVRLTVDGRRAVAATRERLRTAQRTVYENLTAAEQRQASVLLSRLSEAIDEL